MHQSTFCVQGLLASKSVRQCGCTVCAHETSAGINEAWHGHSMINSTDTQTHLLPPVVEETRLVCLNNNNIKEVPPVLPHNEVHSPVPEKDRDSRRYLLYFFLQHFRAHHEDTITSIRGQGMAQTYSDANIRNSTVCPFCTIFPSTRCDFLLIILHKTN